MRQCRVGYKRNEPVNEGDEERVRKRDKNTRERERERKIEGKRERADETHPLIFSAILSSFPEEIPRW